MVYDWPGYPFVEKEAARIDPAQLDDYAGKYSLGDFIVTVWRDGNKLMARGPDDLDTEFYAESDGWFFTADEGPELKFSRDTKGQVTGLTARQYGQSFEFKKAGPARPPSQ